MADDLARLGVVVTPQGITVTTQQLEQLSKRATEAARATEGLGKESTAFGRAISGLGSQVSSAWGNLTSLKSIIVGLGAAAAAREVVELADSYTLMSARLKLVTTSASEAASVQKTLFGIAQQTGTSFTGLADLYTKVARNADQLGASSEHVLRFTQLLSEGIQVSGASASEASAGLLQLSQALASGQVRGDEFRSIMENLSFVAQQVAKNLGLTLGQLRDLSQDGGLTAQKFFSALLGQGQDIDAMFRTMPMTVGRATTMLQNSWGQYVDKVNQATGSTSALATEIRTLADALSDPAMVQTGVDFVNSLAAGLAALRDLAPAAASALSTMGSVLSIAVQGYNLLPDYVQEWGIVVGTVFGKRGLLILGGISEAIGFVDRLGFAVLTMLDISKNAPAALQTPWERLKEGVLDAYEAFKKGGSFWDEFSKRTLGNLGKELQAYGDRNTAMVKARLEQDQLNISISDTLPVLQQAVTWTEKDAKALASLVQKVDPAADATADLKEQVTLLDKAFKTGAIPTEERYLELIGRSIRVYNDRNAKLDTYSKAVKDTIRDLKDQIAVAEEEATHGKKAAERLQLEIQIREALGGKYKENAAQIKELLDLLDKWNGKIETNEAATKRAEENAREWQGIWDNAIKDLQGSFTDLFKSLFDGGMDFAQALANVFKNLFAQVATQALFGNFITSAVGGAGGAAAGRGGGAGGSAAGAAGGALFGGLASGGALGAGSMGGLAGGIQAFAMMNPLTSAVLAAGVGAVGGGALAGAVGLNKTGGSIGGGLGGLGATAMVLAGVNPLLAALAIPLASLFGGLIGKLFEGKPSNKTQGGRFDLLTDTTIMRGGLTGDRFSQENYDAVTRFFDNVGALSAGLKKASPGANFGAVGQLFFETGNRDGTHVAIGGVDTTVGSVGEAWNVVIAQMREKITGLGPVVETAFKTIDLSPDNLERAGALLDFASQVQEYLDGAATSTQKISQIKVQFNEVDKTFGSLGPLLEEIGQSASIAGDLILEAKNKIVDTFIGGLTRTLNELRGESYLNDFQDLVDQITEWRASATDAGRGMELVNEAFTRSIQKIIDGMIKAASTTDAAVTSLENVRNIFKDFPEIIAAIDAAVVRLRTPTGGGTGGGVIIGDDGFPRGVAPNAPTPGLGDDTFHPPIVQVVQNLDLAAQLQADILDKQMAVLRAQAQIAGNNVSTYSRITGTLDDALFQLGTSADLGGTVSQRYAFAKNAFASTLAKARGGDTDAQAALSNIAIEFLNISKEYNATSSAFFDDREAVAEGLESVRSVARQQLDLARSLLTSTDAQTAILLDIRNGLSGGKTGAGGAGGKRTFTAQDAADITTAYGMAKSSSGLSDAEWVNSPAFKTWEATRNTLLGGLTDVGNLQATLDYANANMGDPLYGASNAQAAIAARDRLHELGVPGYDLGGSTGRAFRAHKDETIVMGNRAQVVSAATAKAAVAAQAAASDDLSKTFKGGTMAIAQQVRALAESQQAQADELAGMRRALTLVLERM